MNRFLRPHFRGFSVFLLSLFTLLPVFTQAADKNNSSEATSKETNSPEGLWVTIDDITQKPTSYVRIQCDNGKLSGKIEKILDKKNSGNNCIHCKGDNKNKSIQGMKILWGLTKDGNKYDNGKILDPDSGKVYTASVELQNKGQKLKVRGYIGFSLIGRTQIWERKQKG